MQWLGRRTEEKGGQLRQWMGALGVAAGASTVAAKAGFDSRALFRAHACMIGGKGHGAMGRRQLASRMGETPYGPYCVSVRPLLHNQGGGRSQCERRAKAGEWLQVKPDAGCNVGAVLSMTGSGRNDKGVGAGFVFRQSWE